MRQIFGLILPAEAGARKQFFNEISSGLVVILGACGAILGLLLGGPGWALIGLAAGVAAGGALVEEHRFYRR